MARSEYWAVESVDRTWVILENDAGTQVRFTRRQFPKAREGMIYRRTASGLVRDAKEEHRRLVEARATMKRLSAGDLGEDLRL